VTFAAPKFWLFALVMVRMSGFMLLAPLFSGAFVSGRVKVAVVLALSAFTAATLSAPSVPLDSFATILPAVATEFFAGLLIGFGFNLSMSAMVMAGELAGMQMGLGSASLFDPNSGIDGSLMSNFFALLFTVLLVSMDGHHQMLRLFVGSYAAVPVGGVGLDPVAWKPLLAHSTEMLALGCRLSAPIVIPLLLLTVSVALISRAFPQANVVSLTYGIGAFVGLLLLAASLPGMQAAVQESLHAAMECAVRLQRTLVSG
jgi:flagellar biosynthesis protein FliR